MQGIAEALQLIAKGLLGREGLYSMVFGLLAIVAWLLINRFVVARKRLSWTVLSDSGLQIKPEHVIAELDEPIRKGLAKYSIVMLRIRNTGSSDIVQDDYPGELPNFTFAERTIISCRASSEAHRVRAQTIQDDITAQASKYLGTTPTPDSGAAATTKRAGGSAPTSGSGAAGMAKEVTEPKHNEWTELNLPKVNLIRGAHYKLVIILSGTKKGVKQSKELRAGEIREETADPDRKPMSWNSILRRVALVLTGALVIVFAYFAVRPTAPDYCAAGNLDIKGSSAFMPIIDRVRQRYQQECQGAKITTTETGSLLGIQELRHAANHSETGALSDGAAADGGGGLVPTGEAVLPYSIIVHDDVNVTDNSLTVQQLGRIFSGQARSWKDFGGRDVPITIVGRGAESGTRLTFEKYVLNGPETSPLTSRDCVHLDHPDVPQPPMIRCEHESTADVLRDVQTVPGSIGYVDTPTADRNQTGIRQIAIDRHQPKTLDNLRTDYPFWTVEYLYSYGSPDPNSVLAHFLGYLGRDEARSAFTAAGYQPCIQPDPSRSILDLCTLHGR